ncbi:uncharacterized protein BP5553_08574 [Venustampulla echinocandica]|uniref:Nephrocystin 3-like N-terminal domain-containing protein n=1 Tax=Venustampulla echinocandica TaxID=2656787 RepID=A0A370TEL7_9HELO|nr:uncharacterized protein BP5553_08574 [Venustampulla echinocandica]RDL33135.1 hypothetical protein BP5553_08574 [Venustampulla echinocandica]
MATSSFSEIPCDLFVRNPLLNFESQAQLEKLVDIVVVSLTEVNWLKDPGLSRDALPNARILYFNYVISKRSTGAPYTVKDIAKRFLKQFLSMRSECPLRPIVFVGHCIGGLVIQKALVSKSPSFASSSSISRVTAGVIFFCTPDVLKPDTQALLPFKQELEQLAKEYYDFLALINRLAFLVHSFYEIDGAKIVSPTTSGGPDTPSTIIPGFSSKAISTDPAALGKSGGSAESLFRETHEAVRYFIQKAPNMVSARLDDTTSRHTRPQLAPQDKELLQMLSHINCKSILDLNLGNLLRGYGSWILHDAQTTKWLNEPKSQVLWLHGDAGVGKTVASTYLIQELISIQELRDKIDVKTAQEPQHSGNLIAYFFCQRTESDQQSATIILSNLLQQLLQQRPDLIGLFRDRFKERRELAYLGLKELWTLIEEILHHHSVNTAYLVIEGLDECSHLRDELIRLLQPYIDGIPQHIRPPLDRQASHDGSAPPLHLRGGSGRPPPPPPGWRRPGAEQYMPEPPPLPPGWQLPASAHYMPRPPPPPQNFRTGAPILQSMQRQRPQTNSTQTVEITPPVFSTAEECQTRLTSYKLFSIKKAAPLNLQERPSWVRAEIIEEHLPQEDISKLIKKLNEAGLSAAEKKAALTPFQQIQIARLLDDVTAGERDPNFVWALAQFDRAERVVRLGLRETTELRVYLQRSPLDGLDPIVLWNNIERHKATSQGFQVGGGRYVAGVERVPIKLANKAKMYDDESSILSVRSGTVAEYARYHRNPPRRRPIRMGRRLREVLRSRRRRHRKARGGTTSGSEIDEIDWRTDISSLSSYSNITQDETKTERGKSDEGRVSHSPLAARQPNWTTRICIFITSRNDEYLTQQLSKALEISINLSVEEQIRRLIDRYVPKLLGLDQVFVDKVKKQLVERAQGRLPWIKLAIRELNKMATSDNLIPFLGTIPSQFEGFYQLYLTRDSGLRNKVERAVLTSMLLAMRPLNGSELHFLTRLSGLAEGSLDPSSGLEAYIEATGPFLDISLEGRIWFIHDTARQSVGAILQSDGIDLESLHAVVARHCFKHISKPNAWADRNSHLNYSIGFWMDHCRLASGKTVFSDSLSNEFFQKSSELREKWFDAYWRIRYPKEDKPYGFTLPHVVAESGYYQLLQQLHEQGDWLEDFNSLDSLGNMPLHWAARNGHLKAVELLLMVTDDLDRVNMDQLTPLHFAAIGGHCDIAECLILRGANVDSKARNATTILQSAASEGHQKMVEILLAEGAFIDATDMDGYRAQHLARKYGHIAIAEMLQKYESRMISTESLPGTTRIDGGFIGTVVDFVHSGRYFHKKISVDRMLSNESFDSIMTGAKGDLRPEAEDTESGFENPDPRKVRWLHLPANNMRWVEILMNKQYRDLEMPEAARAILRPEAWADRQHRPGKSIVHGRFMKSGSQKVSTKGMSLNKILECSSRRMPYLNWATEDERKKLNRIIKEVTEANQSSNNSGPNVASDKPDRYERLVWKYVYDEHPLHVRRTLDQSYYSTLHSTETRDVDQIPYKYFHQHFEESTMHPVLMVDQLWLWVLGKDTVITSFPQRWTESKRDSFDADNKTDVLETIIRSVDKNEAAIPDGYELAKFIINACASLCFAVTLSHQGTLPFPGCYETVIGEVADAETHLFREFTQAVVTEAEEATKEAAKGKVKSDLKINEKVFSIHEETKQLELIKDVRDELNMILMILRDQLKAVDESENVSSVKVASLHDNIQLHESEILQLDRRAEKVYIALKDLLDLKQKQANVAEARSQRHQAEETTTQGKAILLFTIITIIFLPLSFLCSFFAIQIVEFPTLTLSFVLRYMFPISAAISVPCIIVALNFDAISKLEVPKWSFPKLWTKKSTKRASRKTDSGKDVEKALTGVEGSRERSGSPQSTNSGSSILSRDGTSRRTRV